MLESIRFRLTLWYTAVLALVLAVLSLASYFILRQATRQQTDSSITELADAFLTTLQAELRDQPGPNTLKLATQEAIVEHRFQDYFFAVLDPGGGLVITSGDTAPASPPAKSSSARLFSSETFRKLVDSSSRADRSFHDVKDGEDRYRGFMRRFPANDQTYTLVVLHSLHREEKLLQEIAQAFAWGIPIAVLLACAGGYFLARKSLAPVVDMATQAGHIGAANLHERLAVRNEKDELGHLAHAFNNLLDRLDQSFERQRRFMADASHELRTPVAILRGEAEVALSQPARSPEEYRESLGVLHGEAQRLTKVIEDLFTLARADAGQYPITLRDFYLDELLTDCVHSTRTLASAKGITLECETPAELPIHADEALLRRMFLNLLDNAIKYTPEGGKVSVSCRREAPEYLVSISDTATGIPAGLQSRIFERFFRADKARSRAGNNTGGAGLGLSIARWIAEAHHGRLELVRSDASGNTFAALLPIETSGTTGRSH